MAMDIFRLMKWKQVLAKQVKQYLEEEINEKIKEVDTDKDGKMSYQEFLEVVKKGIWYSPKSHHIYL